MSPVASYFGNYISRRMEQTRLDAQQSIINDFDIEMLTMTSTAISIAMFNWLNYKQWSREMALLLEQQQVYSMVTGEDERPEDLVELNETMAEKFAHRAAVKDWVKEHGTVRSKILLGIEQWLQILYMQITDAQTL